MEDLQKDPIYKSLLRSLASSVGKISDMYNNAENFSENSAEYQDELINLYPVMENVCRELNQFFGARIRIPKIDEDSTIEQAEHISELVADVKREFKDNPELEDARILFSLKSNAVRQQLEFIDGYIKTLDDENMRSKAGYWFYHNIQALETCLQILTENHEERLWESLCDTNVADSIAAQHHTENYKKDSGLDWTDVLLNSFYNAGLDYLDNHPSEKDFDMPHGVLDVLEREYDVNVSDPDLRQLLKENQKTIKTVFENFKDEHILLAEIGEILDDFDAVAEWDEDENIRNLIDSAQKANKNNYMISLDDDDVKTFIIEYPKISEMADREYAEYLQHQNDVEIMEKYEQSDVDEELKFAFVLKLKDWMVKTAKNAQKVIQPLADLSAGRHRFSDLNEQNRFIDETLELALDAVLISEGVFDYVPNSEDGKTGVMLNSSVIGEGYIKKLIERKDELVDKDYKRLYLFFNEFQSNYEYSRSVLGFTKTEAQLLKKFNLSAYAECLEEQPDCKDKLKISTLSERLLSAAARGRMEKLQRQQDEFIRSSATLHQEEKAVLEDYLQCGTKFTPRLNVEESIRLADSVVMPLVVMPIYNQGNYSEENYLQGMDYAVDKGGNDAAAKSFVKSAINGYKRLLEKKYSALSAETEHSYLHYLARGYFRTLDKQQEIDEAKDVVCGIRNRQEEIFQRWSKYDEYKNKKHPSQNHITALLIKNRKRGGK